MLTRPRGGGLWTSLRVRKVNTWQACPDGCFFGAAARVPRRQDLSRRSRAGRRRHRKPRPATATTLPRRPGQLPRGPLVVHIPDPRTGEIHLMVGTREVVRTDPALVARLVRDAG